METVNKKDFIEIKYSGYANGVLFDSNIPEQLKKISPKDNIRETILVVGEGMVVPGLDEAFVGKEVGKEFTVEMKSNKGFGERRKDLIRMIPLKVFHEKNVNPQVGMVFALDDMLAKIISVSGARVMTDFNNPLAGKDLKYEVTIVRKVTDDETKARITLEALMRFKPEFEVKDKVFVKGPKGFKVFVDAFKDKFKDLVGKELDFEEKAVEKKEEKKEN
jgi:FKBP-type peptidyl-prolyl cis-trans isomerase SlyD